MKVRINQNSHGDFYWILPGQAEGTKTYTRKADAKRGFKRFISQTRNVMIGRVK